jgi:formylglycine-generating enzyme required for sulfatase activity
MVYVPPRKGLPGFFIQSQLVSYGDFADLFPNQKKPTRNRRRSRAPVTGVSFAYAEAYARTKGGRLPSPDELSAAQEDELVDTSSSILEWLDDGTEGTQAPRLVATPDGTVARRRPRAHKDVGFRLVQELP